MTTPLVIMGACGRMGKTIIELARGDVAFRFAGFLEREECLGALHGAPCPVGSSAEDLLPLAPNAVIIDFTSPQTSLATARIAARLKNPMVIGTTGLAAEQTEELEELARRTPIFWAPNMSVGISVLLQILPELVRLLGETYDLDVLEIHHNRKKDAPSGTALKLAACLAEARQWSLPEVSCCSRHGIIGERPHKEIGIQAIRGGDVVGVHTVYCMGPGERIEITHQAHSRENFAQGALRAARWLAQQPAGKLYAMRDIF